MGSNEHRQTRDWGPPLRSLMRLLVVGCLVWLTHLAVSWLMVKINGLENAASLRIGVLGVLLLVYAMLMAVPFVPGVEIGISLMVLEGGSITPFVYVATLVGLLVAYFVGRWVDHRVIQRVVRDLRLTRTGDLIENIAPLNAEQRIAMLDQRLPDWIAPKVVRFRYVVLALLLNLPGNVIIGGGGGLALIAGFSRIYTIKQTVLTLAIAVSPVPIMVYFLDFQPFG